MGTGSQLSLGTLIAVCTVVATGVVLGARGPRMFSPGPLAAKERSGKQLGGVSSHAELAGTCSACHVPPWSKQTMEQRCLDCHGEVRAQIDGRLSIHGTMPNGTRCRACHTEHLGEHARITDFTAFNHDWCAFKLTGKHKGASCASCHKSSTYRGVPQVCAGCHAEPKIHVGKFGTDCARCHSTATWQVASFPTGTGGSFDHGRTAFPLTGKHIGVDCKSCHVNNTFKGTPTSCVSCHAEPKSHKGQFGLNCASCHSTEGWGGATFAHGFPINHAKAQQKGGCAMCHNDATNYKSYTCSNCHKHDLAKTAEKHRKFGINDVSNCATCHPNGRKKRVALGGDVDLAGLALCVGCPGGGDSVLSLLASARTSSSPDLTRFMPPQESFVPRVTHDAVTRTPEQPLSIFRVFPAEFGNQVRPLELRLDRHARLEFLERQVVASDP
jgi:hypothetical protein